MPVFVDHTCIDTPGYRVLVEGQRVLFRGRSRAEVVKPATAEAVSVERELAR
ncbi:hypothetical protein [Nocardia arizonensis]|uniref:hypothetical protein n=1 Tax=Nocardia arizonensis TaxID=1141647 RepID=UPI0012E2A2BE|nr:hypothetical protein [Nocardia arizonensis]